MYNYTRSTGNKCCFVYRTETRELYFCQPAKGSVRKKQPGTETRRNLQVSHGRFPRGSLAASSSVFYRRRSIVS